MLRRGIYIYRYRMRSKLSETTNFANPTDDQKLDSLSLVLLSLLCRKPLATGNKENKEKIESMI